MADTVIGHFRADLSLDTAEFQAGAARARTSMRGVERTIGGGAANVNKSLNGMSGGARAAMQQLSQVAQSGMATGNWLQSLAIQLPDLAMGFGTMGMAIGIVAGVTLPLLGSMFGSAEDRAKALKTTLDNLSGAVDAYKASAEAARKPSADYGTMAAQAALALAAKAKADQAAAENAVKSAVKGLFDESTVVSWLGIGQVFGNQIATMQQSAVGFGKTVLTLKDDFGLAADDAKKLVTALDALRTAEGVKAQVDAAAKLLAMIDSLYPSLATMPQPMQDFRAVIVGVVTEGAKLSTEIDKAATSARGLATVNIAGNIQAAVAAAAALSAEYGIALELAQQLAGMKTTPAGGGDRGLGFGKGGLDDPIPGGSSDIGGAFDGRDFSKPYRGSFDPTIPSAKSGGGGGGAAKIDEYARAVETLTNENERLRISMTQGALAERIYTAQKQAGVEANTQQGRSIAALVTEQDRLQRSQKTLQSTSQMASETAQGLQTFFSSLVTGAESARGALSNLASSLAQMLANAAFMSMLEGLAGGSGPLATAANWLIGGNANGTNNWRGGLTMVGERGPELVNMSRGSRVWSNSESKRMLRNAGGGRSEAIVTLSPELRVEWQREAGNNASKIAQGHLRQYDRGLNGRINSYERDPRKRG